MKKTSQHKEDVKKHGDQAMGFPHDKITYHFQIDPTARRNRNDRMNAKDSQNIQAIQRPFKHIAAMFSQGDLAIPMFVHDQLAPGIEGKKRPDFVFF